MVTKQVTFLDLSNLENKITKEQTEYRHDDRKKLSECMWTVDSLKTDSALSKQSFTTMTKSIEKLEQVVVDGFKEIREEFKSMNTIFATKAEHQANKLEIETIKATHSKVITWVIGTVWTIFLAFLWLIVKTIFLK